MAYHMLNAAMHQAVLGKIVLDPRYRSVYARDDVYVFKRVSAADAPAPGSAAPDTP